ncbi:MAG: hypothetical protein ACI9G5_001756, partial [Paracoccaceae bacterium]
MLLEKLAGWEMAFLPGRLFLLLVETTWHINLQQLRLPAKSNRSSGNWAAETAMPA